MSAAVRCALFVSADGFSLPWRLELDGTAGDAGDASEVVDIDEAAGTGTSPAELSAS